MNFQDVEELSDRDFSRISVMVHSLSGINLGLAKKSMTSGRLMKRLRALGMTKYSDYLDHITSPGGQAELQNFINAISTNETFFFREPDHFDFLRDQISPAFLKSGRILKIWSAACSSGAEVYSAAMILEETGVQYSILGSDINDEKVKEAAEALFPMLESRKIPEKMLRKYCLRGVRKYDGTFTIVPEILEKCGFRTVNLMHIPGDIGRFDVIFLRNVMIYFTPETKKELLVSLTSHLNPDGYLIIGHSESITLESSDFHRISATIYRKNK